MRCILAIVGSLSLQRGPLWWASVHRHHHIHCDTETDVHSPQHHGMFYAHMGWLMCRESYELKLEHLGQVRMEI